MERPVKRRAFQSEVRSSMSKRWPLTLRRFGQSPLYMPPHHPSDRMMCLVASKAPVYLGDNSDMPAT
jgi:hypothetical protein